MDPSVLKMLTESIKDFDESNPSARVLLYGMPGSGKTTLALMIAQAISRKNILFVDSFEELSVVKINSRWNYLGANVIRMPYQGMSQIAALTVAIAEGAPGFDNFDCVVLDVLSQMADQNLDAVMDDRVKKDPSKDRYEPKQPDMNVATQTVSNTIHNLYTAGVHVIATSHSRKDKDSRGIEVTSPGFMPKLGSKLMGPPQVVGYVNADIVPNPEGVDSYTRFVQILPTINVVAKSKFSELPPKVDFETLVEAFRSFLTSNDDIRVI